MTELIVYNQAIHALQCAVNIDEVKTIRDKAVAMEAYAKQAKDGRLLAWAGEIRLRAERKAGEYLRDMPKAKGGQPYQSSTPSKMEGVENETDIKTLAEQGISYKESIKWQNIAAIPNEVFEEQFMQSIKTGDKSANEVLREYQKTEKETARALDIEAQKTAIETENLTIPQGLYDVIVIDPPWPYGRAYDATGSRVSNPYPEMTLDEIAGLALPVKDDAIIFLWTTHAFLFDAKTILDTWRFAYKATLVWDKDTLGMGHWFRMQCEFCLVGVKGNPFFENKTFRDIIRELRREHSRKPDGFYKMVEAITAGRKLEYFAREARLGFESFGNEVDKFD